jgi:4-hydroxy-tetrahydrodipicolinate synthase
LESLMSAPVRRTIASPFQGAMTALVTPFRDGRIDEAAFQALVERQIAAGIHGLVPVGTTGESPTLSHEEHYRVFDLTLEAAAGRVPVVAGCGSNDTATAIEHCRQARKRGADAALLIAPYYNRPNQAGLIAHFRAIADAVELPMLLYNVPGRTACDILPETVGALAAHPNIVGLKDATGDMVRVRRHIELAGEDFALLSGDDGSALAFNAAGGIGAISVTSNVAPGDFARLQTATLADDFPAARAIDARLAGLHRALFSEPSPAPAKWALSRLDGGLCAPDVRLPLTPLSEGAQALVRAAMRQAGLDPA